jgi:anti-sigma factor ChrR (cupin superfamily)
MANTTTSIQSSILSIHADHSQRVVAYHPDLPWVDSPVMSVRRRMLERDGGEKARATSIVHYAAGTRFAEHRHDFGEEFLVLEGTFEDEHGSYPAGTYVKNPPGSKHTPSSETSCTLFVKLRHMEARDTERVVTNWHQASWHPGLVSGLSVLPLWQGSTSGTALVRWAPGTQFNPHRHWGGEEIFVIDGVFEDEHGRYPAGSWLRSPHLSAHRPFSIEGCTIFVKTGHLDVPTSPK